MAATYLFQVVGGVPVVSTPAEIDRATVSELHAILLEWHSRRDNTVVVDMSGTLFCDAEGLRELAAAHERAAADGGGLRLVLPSGGSFLQSFTVSGLDGIIPSFATMEEALARIPEGAFYHRRGVRAPEPATARARPQAPIVATRGLVTDGRGCAQCGALFVPRREHARFCGRDCRAAWNREHLGDPATEGSPLIWSIAAMTEATALLPAVRASDQQGALAAIGDVVWWVTMVDATLVRHHSEDYGTVMAARTVAERQSIDESLAGLRFVRNWTTRGTGLRGLIDAEAASRRITNWTWKAFPAPALEWLSPRAQAWELARYRAYQVRLAGQTIGETFEQVVSFLTLAGASAEPCSTANDASTEFSYFT